MSYISVISIFLSIIQEAVDLSLLLFASLHQKRFQILCFFSDLRKLLILAFISNFDLPIEWWEMAPVVLQLFQLVDYTISLIGNGS